MKTGNGNGSHLRVPSLVPQYGGQYILPFSVQEDFAARLARLNAEGRLPTLMRVRTVLARILEDGTKDAN